MRLECRVEVRPCAARLDGGVQIGGVDVPDAVQAAQVDDERLRTIGQKGIRVGHAAAAQEQCAPLRDRALHHGDDLGGRAGLHDRQRFNAGAIDILRVEPTVCTAVEHVLGPQRLAKNVEHEGLGGRRSGT